MEQSFFSSGGYLFREDVGVAVSVRVGAGSGDVWRRVHDLPDASGAGRIVDGVHCAGGGVTLCLLAVRAPGRDAQTWHVIDVTAPPKADGSLIVAGHARVQDVDAVGGGTALVTSSGDGEAFPRQGLYLWRLQTPPSSARFISSDAYVFRDDVAAFMPGAASSERWIVALVPGSPVRWTILSGAGEQLISRPAPGPGFTVTGRTLLAASAAVNADGVLTPGALSFYQPRGAGGEWNEGVVFASASEPLLVRDKDAAASADVGVGASGAVVVTLRTPAGPRFAEVCRTSAENRTRLLPQDAATPFVEGWIEGDAGTSPLILNTRDTWGQVHQFELIEPPADSPTRPLRSCEDGALEMRRLGSAPALTDPLETMTATATARDGTILPYTVISRPGATGKVMIRPYGAFGELPKSYAVGALEREWLAAGNLLVVPTLRGDAGDAGWVAAGRGDHKSVTSADLLAVAEDLVRTGAAKPGDVVLAGYSAGAFVAARAALARPQLFDAVLLFSGAMDVSTLSPRLVDLGEFGDLEGGLSRWFPSEAPPLDDPPRFLLWHAEDDERVPVQSSINFAQFLGSLGYRGELKVSRLGGHAVGQRVDTAPAALAFIAESAE